MLVLALRGLEQDLGEVGASKVLQLMVVKCVGEKEIILIQLGVGKLLPQQPQVLATRPHHHHAPEPPQRLASSSVKAFYRVYLRVRLLSEASCLVSTQASCLHRSLLSLCRLLTLGPLWRMSCVIG